LGKKKPSAYVETRQWSLDNPKRYLTASTAWARRTGECRAMAMVVLYFDHHGKILAWPLMSYPPLL